MRPPLTIIVPCAEFDSRAQQCLQALLKDLEMNDELVMVFDGSRPDVTALSDRVHPVFIPQRKGPATARNRGAAVAQGEVLVFVDADVVVHAGVISKIRNFFLNGQGDAVFGCYDDEPAHPGFVSQFRNLQHHYVHATNGGDATTFWAGCGAIRRDAFLQSGGFDETYRLPAIEDVELGMRLVKAGHRIVLDPAMQGKHLKQWSLLPMWRNDLLCRALPWSRLIVAGEKMPQGLNTNRSARLAVAAQGLAMACGLLAVLNADFGWAALLLQFIVLICHAGLLGFLARARGPAFALGSVPLVVMYVLLSGTGFVWAMAEYWLRKLTRRSNGAWATRTVVLEADGS